jgi:uncharacterized membrane protein YcaP (DUF421 family)
MATHFVGAVKEHTARLAAQQSGPSPDAIVAAAIAAVLPHVVNLVQASNTKLVRSLRNNPQVLVR